MDSIQTNILRLRSEIHEEAQKIQRDSNSISLLAVSKTQPSSAVAAAIAAGQIDFGENYLQDGLEKVQQNYAAKPIWHFIGAIQSNKTSAIATHFNWVHSLERIKIAKRLSTHCAESTRLEKLNCCIQINISGDPNKAGIALANVENFAEQLQSLPNLTLRGFMAVATATDDEQQIANEFAAVEASYQRLREQGHELDTLSMGMSNDWRIAIKYGATMIRIGTDIFGARQALNKQ